MLLQGLNFKTVEYNTVFTIYLHTVEHFMSLDCNFVW